MTTFAEPDTGRAVGMTDDQARLLAYVDAHPSPHPTPERDRLGRYKLRHPVSGKDTAWTRATTLAGTLDDTYNLTKWACRLTALGVATPPHVAEQLSMLGDPNGADKAVAMRLADEAKALAGGSLSASVGTAIHCLTEHYDLGTEVGEDLSPAGEPWVGDVLAYAAALHRAGIGVPPEWVERIVLCLDLNVAGTLDRIVTLPDGRHVILDVKTGSSIDHSLGTIAAQLAIYAHATHLWNPTDGTYEAMPPVDQSMALVAHMPAGTGTCTLHEVDIEAGWDLARLCVDVRAARKRGKALGRPHTPAGAAAPTVVTEAAIKRRVADIKERYPELLAPMRTAWDATGIAKRPPWTTDELVALDVMMLGVLMPDEGLAAANATPAPEAPPADVEPPLPDLPAPTDGNGPGDPDAVHKALADLKAAKPALFEVLHQWVTDGRAAGRDWKRQDPIDERGEAIVHAAVAILANCWQPDKAGGGHARVRAILAYVIVDDVDWRHPVGAVLGSLTLAQATEARLVAECWRGDPARRTTINGIAQELAA
jgi:hypothetical protein